MKLTNEICVSFLRKSGWLYNHDKEITISERNKDIDDFGSKLEKDVLFTLDRIRAYERNKAIDDFVKEICKMIVQSENNGNYRFYAVEIKQAIADLAEQLKAGAGNDKSI